MYNVASDSVICELLFTKGKGKGQRSLDNKELFGALLNDLAKCLWISSCRTAFWYMSAGLKAYGPIANLLVIAQLFHWTEAAGQIWKL